MVADPEQVANQAKLKAALQGEEDAGKLEALAADLISGMVEVDLAVAKRGFQHGGDFGPAGQQGRRFRVEAKKYRELRAKYRETKPADKK